MLPRYLSLNTKFLSLDGDFSRRGLACPLPPNVVKGSMGHRNIATTTRFDNQADEDKRARAARVLHHSVSSPTETTDTELAPEANAAF